VPRLRWRIDPAIVDLHTIARPEAGCDGQMMGA